MKFLITTLIIASSFMINAQSINKNDLKTHISFLASDSLKGRKPGTKEMKVAADYIRREFKNNDLTLLGENGYQYFDITTGIKANSNNHLYINKFSCKTFEDNTPLPFSGNGTVSGKVVFAGYGFDINTDKIKWNDYKNIEVKNKWVLILRGIPETSTKDDNELEPYSSDRSKVMTAIKKGASGVLLVSGEKFDKKDMLSELKYGRGNAQVEIPVIQIKRNLANKILPGKKKITDLETELAENKKPVSFETKTKVKGTVNIEYIKTRTQNIVALLPGNNKTLSQEYIIVGAHYDHLGLGGKNSGSRMPDTIAVHNGADDNASGVASLLEIAQKFKDKNIRPDRSILFIAFSGEETGLLGSAYFVSHPLIDLKKAYLMINLDMTGRLKDNNTVTIAGTGTAKEFEKILEKLKDKTDLKLSFSPGGYGASDHSSFYMEDIPVLFLNTGAHEDYHTPFDDTEKINFEGQVKVTKFAFELLKYFAGNNESLTYQSTGMPKKNNASGRGLKVTLGVIPGFGDTENKGLRIDGTKKGGPAEISGIKRGDYITAINGEKIANIYDYMEVLNKLKKGQKITVNITRKDKKLVLPVQL